MSKTCCCVPLCGNKQGGHRFPKMADMVRKWMLAIRRDKWKPSPTSVVCKLHFTPADYISDTYYGKQANNYFVSANL